MRVVLCPKFRLNTTNGIPAITLGAGGTSGNSHTLNEWYDPRGRETGLKRALLVMLGLVK